MKMIGIGKRIGEVIWVFKEIPVFHERLWEKNNQQLLCDGDRNYTPWHIFFISIMNPVVLYSEQKLPRPPVVDSIYLCL